MNAYGEHCTTVIRSDPLTTNLQPHKYQFCTNIKMYMIWEKLINPLHLIHQLNK